MTGPLCRTPYRGAPAWSTRCSASSFAPFLALGLHFIQAAIRRPEERLCRLAISGIDGNPKAQHDRRRLAATSQEFRNASAHLPGRHLVGLRKYHRELVPTEPRGSVYGPA